MLNSDSSPRPVAGADTVKRAWQGSPAKFLSVQAYNAAFPERSIPTDPAGFNGLRCYHAAMAGVQDDVDQSGYSLTVDFLPGGAPLPGGADRLGMVVATRWGSGPVFVLAENVSLRAAWRAIIDAWPTQLSGVRSALASLG
ncbi:hypothetical protein [Amycolatopsis sp. lyj-108]|uniref:hypothetical protein n=1 Tax=Amycolatopsis sp. lyj-108 TaxID=2789286 RepID=UPI00397DF7B9